MLQREPERRASLEDIAADPWLNEGDTTQPADYLPLVSREHLSDESHSFILKKLIAGSIASHDEIIQ